MSLATISIGTKRRAAMAAPALLAASLAGTSIWVNYRARRAVRENPPAGAFVTVDGVRVHYLERGTGTPLVLLHGNVVRSEDFVASGLLDRLSERHRVIAFDRPGFGHSARPRDRAWTARAQAALLHGAMQRLGIADATIVAHSWSTLIALAIAAEWPQSVRKLVLLSGYYFPTVRLDVALASPPAIPIVGDVMRYTVSPVFARLLLRKTVKAMFAPQRVPSQFLPTLSREMLVRPSQIRASAEDAAFMIPSAAELRHAYAEPRIPVAIFAGSEDQVASPDEHARRLHGCMPSSTLHIVSGAGHMVHYVAQDEIEREIEMPA